MAKKSKTVSKRCPGDAAEAAKLKDVALGMIEGAGGRNVRRQLLFCVSLEVIEMNAHEP